MAEQLKKGVQKLMECPVCLETPQFTPIYRCSAGHILCKDCHGKVENCPICKIKMGKERCLLAEQLLYQLPARCKYFSMECKTEWLDRDKLREHQLECPNRPIRCISMFCKKDIQIGRLADHLKEDHKCGGPEALPHTGTIFISEDIFKRDLCWCWMMYFCMDGKNFFGLIARTVGGLWHSWVYMSSPKRGIPYKYKFIVSSEDDYTKVIYQGDCLFVDDFTIDSMTTVAGAAPKLIFDDSTVRKFATKASPEKLGIPGEENLILTYHVEIADVIGANLKLPTRMKRNSGAGDVHSEYNDMQEGVRQLESKLNMWKQLN